MNTSETIGKLAEALSKAQGSMQSAVKNSENPHFKNKFADLASLWDSVRAPFAANGLSVMQIPYIGEDGRVRLETKLMHSSGEWISSHYPIKPTKDDPQGMGSALTYARRYAFSAMTGAIGEDDDDGNSASANTPQRYYQPQASAKKEFLPPSYHQNVHKPQLPSAGNNNLSISPPANQEDCILPIIANHYKTLTQGYKDKDQLKLLITTFGSSAEIKEKSREEQQAILNKIIEYEAAVLDDFGKGGDFNTPHTFNEEK
jgi:hypothetical protein